MKNALYVLSCLILISCGKNPEKEYRRAVESYKSSKSGIPRVLEASAARHGGFIVDDEQVRSGMSSLYSVKGSKVFLHMPGGSEKYIVPEGAPFYGAVVAGETCYIAAGKNLLIFHGGSSYDRVITFPGKAEVWALELWSEGILILAGRKLYILRNPSESPEPVFERAFSSPDKKIFRGILTRSGKNAAIILGYAGRYHIALVDAAGQKIFADKISAAGRSCYLDGNTIYYISGGSGTWKVTRFNGKSKVKKTVRTFTRIVNVSLFKRGFALETPERVTLFDYKRAMVPLPVTGELKGRTGENLVVTINNETTLSVPFNEFRKDLADLQGSVPEMFKAVSDK